MFRNKFVTFAVLSRNHWCLYAFHNIANKEFHCLVILNLEQVIRKFLHSVYGYNAHFLSFDFCIVDIQCYHLLRCFMKKTDLISTFVVNKVSFIKPHIFKKYFCLLYDLKYKKFLRPSCLQRFLQNLSFLHE